LADRTLKMQFKNAVGGSITVSVDNPKAALTPAEVTQAMTDIITQNLFTSRGGDLVEAVGATIITQSALV